jgi:hypothetical protein
MLENLLPLNGVPRSGAPENCVQQWCGLDNQTDYRKRGGHPLYSETDIEYRYNSHGYRCPDFASQAQIRVVSIGCSCTLGVGVPQGAIFHELFAERLRLESGSTVVNWNLGRNGASNDHIARVLHLAIPKLNPHLVLILFTKLARREYLAVHDQWMNYTPAGRPADPVIRELSTHFDALSSAFDDELNFFRNYKSVEYLLADRLWLCSMLGDQLRVVGGHLNEAHHANRLRWLDKGRDNSHPGPQTHELLYREFWAKFVDTGGLDRLQSRIR